MTLSLKRIATRFCDNRNRLFCFLTLICLSLAVAQQANAQQVWINGNGGGNANDAMRKQFMDALEKNKLAAENRIASRIADIDRACQLSDEQKRKLQIASKGAVKSSMTKAKKQMMETAKQMGINFDPDKPEEPKEAEEEGEDDEEGLVERRANFAIFPGMFGSQDANDIENEKLWKSALQKTLTKEQNDKLTQWQDQRKKYQRQVAVGNFVAKVDRELLLSPEQREKLTSAVDEKYGENLLKNALANNSQQLGRFVFAANVAVAGGEAPEEEKDDLVSGILTPSQTQQWQEKFAQELKQAAQFRVGAAGNVIRAINIAAPMIVEEEEVDDEDDDN